MHTFNRYSLLCLGALVFSCVGFAQTIQYTTQGLLQTTSGSDKLGLGGTALTVTNSLDMSQLPIPGTTNQYNTTISISDPGTLADGQTPPAVVTINYVSGNPATSSINVVATDTIGSLVLTITSSITVPSITALTPAPIAFTALSPTDTLTVSDGSNITTYEFVSGDIYSIPSIPSSCTYSVTPATLSFPEGGGTAAVTVTLTGGTDCTPWTAGSSSPWLTVAPAVGNGNGSVLVTAAANTTSSAETGTLTIAGQVVSVTEAAATACVFSVTPSSYTFPALGGQETFDIVQTGGGDCTWTVFSTVPWIALAPIGGNGNGTLVATATPNTTGAPLTGSINIAGETINVAELPVTGTCTYSVSPTSISFNQAGETTPITVMASAPTCAWTASSNEPWASVTPTNSEGNGTVFLTVQANNTGAPQTATLTIAGQAVTITQGISNTCTFTVTPNPNPLDYPSTGGTDTISIVASDPLCVWNASVVPSWITLSTPAGTGISGTGSTTISAFAYVNTGKQRSGDITIAGITIVATEAAPTGCTFSVTPPSLAFPSGGATEPVTVTASMDSCTWTASSGATFVTVSPKSGTGTGTVEVTAIANSLSTQQTTTLSIAGQTVTVTESPVGCVFVVTPNSVSFPGGGGTIPVTVSAPNTQCTWQAISTVPWLTVSPAFGSGNGTVNLIAAPNPTGTPLTGAITVGGNVISVSQAAGAGCTFSVDPSAVTFPETGGSVVKSIVASGSNCTWTVTAPSWITLSATSGTGSGSVTLTAADDTNGPTLSGTAVIAGVSVPVMETGGCTFTISPNPIAVDANPQAVTVNVTASPSSCSWLATPPPFATVSVPGGTGDGSTTLIFSANTTGADSVGILSIAGQSIPVTQDFTVQAFSDVLPGSFDFDAVNILFEKGITTGCSTTMYCPNSDLTRSQMAVLVIRGIFGTGTFPYPPNPIFKDVPPGSFGYADIQEFSALGITSGCGTDLFCPAGTVNRDQAAVFFEKARLGGTTLFPYPTTPYFTDVPPTYFAFSEIQRFAADGITTGCGPNAYCPGDPVTRGQAAIFLVRSLFNELLVPNTPYITSVIPNILVPGTQQVLTVTGFNTNWSPGQTGLLPINGIVVDNVTVTNSNAMTVTLTTNPNIPVQPYSLSATTGTELDVLPNGLLVQ